MSNVLNFLSTLDSYVNAKIKKELRLYNNKSPELEFNASELDYLNVLKQKLEFSLEELIGNKDIIK